MRISSDDLGVVAFVLPAYPNREFSVEQGWDGAFVLTPVELPAAADVSGEVEQRRTA